MRSSLATILLVTMLAGCGSLPQARTSASPATPALESAQTARLNNLLQALRLVVAGTPTEQAEVMAKARADFESARQGPAALALGMLLAAPAHPARDAAQAQRLLREALAREELLTAAERALGAVELERLTAELLAAAENKRLVTEAQQDRDRQRNAPSSAALTRQLQTANETIAQLRRQLDEARAKLDAIAELERRQARPPATNGSNP